MTSTHRWLADEAKDTRRLVPFPCLRQNPAGVRHERIPKLGADGKGRKEHDSVSPQSVDKTLSIDGCEEAQAARINAE